MSEILLKVNEGKWPTLFIVSGIFAFEWVLVLASLGNFTVSGSGHPVVSVNCMQCFA